MTLQIDWQKYMDQYGISGLEISAKDQQNMNWNVYLLAPIFSC